VADISQEDLIAAVQPLVTKVLDVRKTANATAKAC
jgi:hypothetical protein